MPIIWKSVMELRTFSRASSNICLLRGHKFKPLPQPPRAALYPCGMFMGSLFAHVPGWEVSLSKLAFLSVHCSTQKKSFLILSKNIHSQTCGLDGWTGRQISHSVVVNQFQEQYRRLLSFVGKGVTVALVSLFSTHSLVLFTSVLNTSGFAEYLSCDKIPWPHPSHASDCVPVWQPHTKRWPCPLERQSTAEVGIRLLGLEY